MITFALLTPEGDGVAFLHKVGDRVFIEKYQGNTYSLFNKDGGNRWDGESGAFNAWGDWAEEVGASDAGRGRLKADSQDFSKCISVCVTQTVSAWNAYIKDEYTSTKNKFCLACKSALSTEGGRDPENCSACAQLYLNKHKLRIAEGEGGLLHGKAISKCFDDCDKPGTWKCIRDETYKLCSPGKLLMSRPRC